MKFVSLLFISILALTTMGCGDDGDEPSNAPIFLPPVEMMPADDTSGAGGEGGVAEGRVDHAEHAIESERLHRSHCSKV